MKVLLAQTDTTVGFLSQDAETLVRVKGRNPQKPFLKVFCDFRTLQEHTRIPEIYKNWVRHARKSTFVVKNQAFRYVSDPEHAKLIRKYGWLYSTSANESGSSYNPDFCSYRADWIIEDERGLCELEPSKIYRLGQKNCRRLR